MYSANIHEAKTHLSRLIEKAIAGEEVVISKAGKPMVRLVPYQQAVAEPRPLGIWRGKVSIAEDFDELPSEIMDAFLGEHP
jgi:prevent-host-death family protein